MCCCQVDVLMNDLVTLLSHSSLVDIADLLLILPVLPLLPSFLILMSPPDYIFLLSFSLPPLLSSFSYSLIIQPYVILIVLSAIFTSYLSMQVYLPLLSVYVNGGTKYIIFIIHGIFHSSPLIAKQSSPPLK